MSTVTAQIIVGTSPVWSGGIVPDYQLFFSENSRPAWALYKIPGGSGNHLPDPGRPVVWIPTIEHLLEDAIVMIHRYVIDDEVVAEQVDRKLREKEPGRAELYRDIDLHDLEIIRELCRKSTFQYKLLITVLAGSSIESQLGVLKRYSFEYEICGSVFRSAAESSHQGSHLPFHP